MHSACAVAIGALTYNKTAFRLLYNLVRRDPSKNFLWNFIFSELLIFILSTL